MEADAKPPLDGATGSARYCDDPDNCGYADCPTTFCDRDQRFKIRPDGSCYVEGESPARPGSGVGGDFYNGIEWLACWMLDNVEGETITEEQMRSWAVRAWEAHLKRPNSELSNSPTGANRTNE